MIAIRVALTRCCAQICTSIANATANSPVTSNAAQTVVPCGTERSPSATAIAPNTTHAVATSTNVSANTSKRFAYRSTHHDLQRLRESAQKDEQVAGARALRRSREQRETDQREADGRPEHARDARAKERERE